MALLNEFTVSFIYHFFTIHVNFSQQIILFIENYTTFKKICKHFKIKKEDV